MAAGDWSYQGIREVREDEDEHDTRQLMYWIETRRPLPQILPGLDRYARLRILVARDPGRRDGLDAYKIVVDSVDAKSTLSIDDEVVDSLPDHGQIPADSDLLRGVPFRRLMTQAAADLREREREHIEHGQQTLPVDFFGGEVPDFRALRAEWPKGDTERVASWAGHLYAAAVADGQPANRAVEDAFGVSRTTAQRMIARARELGFLADDVVGAPVPSRTRKGHDNEQGTS